MTSATTQDQSRGSFSTRFLIVLVGIVSLVAAGYLLFVMADDTVMVGENSPAAKEFVDGFADDPEGDVPFTHSVFPSTFGPETGPRTLVLYDGGNPWADLHGLASAQLATHFGPATMHKVGDYTPGLMHEYDAAIYIGQVPGAELPWSFTSDVLSGVTKVLWAGRNIDQLGGGADTPELALFTEIYGWDPSQSMLNGKDKVTTILYKDQDLPRPELAGFINVPRITNPAQVEILGTVLCGTVDTPKQCEGAAGTDFPWAVRSGNLTYVADIPVDVIEEGTHHIAFADLYYDLLAPDTVPTRKAAVRIEDVGPEADPAQLHAVADFLHERGIPFQVAVVPVHVAEVPRSSPARSYALTLLDSPKVVDALKYMQSKGGTLIQHGTSHQYGTLQNPYQGATSGADYEFLRARCSATAQPPFEFEECRTDSWVRLTGPVPRDEVEQHAERMKRGRDIMTEAGLGTPTIFEVPHYAASPNAYEAISHSYEYRYERAEYLPGLTSGDEFPDPELLSQIFPFRVHDVYGLTVLPENLGNVSEVTINNHPPRPPAQLVKHAERNLVVREATASFFFHPFLKLDYLDELVTGIQDLGYTFVPAVELS